MKIGIPVFGYEHYKGFIEQYAKYGVYDVNIGDNMQTIATRNTLGNLGFSEDEIIPISRDTLTEYQGPPVHLITNGVFAPHCFPFSEKITPVFFGLFLREPSIEQHRSYFKKYEPIGCRDIYQAELFKKYDIAAEVTGCLTLTLPSRASPPTKEKLFIVYGSGSGRLPMEVLRHVPPKLLETAELLYQRMPVGEHPLPQDERKKTERQAEKLTQRIRDEASLVLTPLHHAATPAIAGGIPVIMARETIDGRFSYLQKLLRIYLPGEFEEIDWSPAPVAIHSVKEEMTAKLRARLQLAGISPGGGWR